MEAMFTEFSQHISQTQAKISKVQKKLKLQNADDVLAVLSTLAQRSEMTGTIHDQRNTELEKENVLAVLSTLAQRSEMTATTHDQKNTELEKEKCDLISSFSAEKQRYENEILGLKEQIYTIRAQLISNSSSSYKKSMDAMRERRTKTRLYSPTSIATDLDGSSAYDEDCVDYYGSLNTHHPERKSETTQTMYSSSSIIAGEDEEVVTLKRQLEIAKKETEAANEASREILRRYTVEMTSAKQDLIYAQQQIAQLEEALETHEIKSNERLTQAQGDIILLQVDQSIYFIISPYLFVICVSIFLFSSRSCSSILFSSPFVTV